MPRWIAEGTIDEWNNIRRFREELSDSSNWRPNPRTTVTTVLSLANGSFLAECHAARQEDFETWLENKGWEGKSITPVRYAAKAGSIWEGK